LCISKSLKNFASFIEERKSVRDQDPDERERRISRFSGLQELKLSEVDEQAILEEQNKDMLQIEKDLVELADCFIDMANEVKIQGEELNKVENNTSKSAIQVEQGTGEVSKAFRYAQAARKKIVVLIILSIILLGILAIIIWLAVCTPWNNKC